MAAAYVNEKMNLVATKRQKRREKSRDAARSRRHKESNTFDDICNAIPIPQQVLSHLDKSAIMRLLIAYIKLRQVMNGRKTDRVEEIEARKSPLGGEDYVNSLNGFLLILSSELDVLYVSDNVKDYLGLSTFDLTGQNILQYTHEGDHEELNDCFDRAADHTTFFLRLKSTLTVNGKNINLKSASYKVLRCNGVVAQNAGESPCLIAHAEPLPHPANIEHLLDSRTFVSQHTPDMKFTYCDEKFCELLAYTEADVLDRSYFDFCHVADMKPINDYFHKLFRLSQVETSLYRFLGKSGGYLWLVTQATVINNQKNHKPQCIVCVHYVLSELEHSNSALSSEQLKHCPALETVEKVKQESVVDTDVSVPSLDDCEFVELAFDDLDENEELISEPNLCFNAPSIGDPCFYSEDSTSGTITDVLEDVVEDSTLVAQQPSPMYDSTPVAQQASPAYDFALTDPQVGPTYDPLALTEIPPPNSRPQSLPRWESPSRSDVSMGSVSPCDSAYFGSPTHEPFSPYTLPNSSPKPPEPQCAMAWQPVGVPREQMAVHANQLKRALEEGGAPTERKRRCVQSKLAAVKPPAWKAASPDRKLNPVDWNPLTNPVLLLQPGDSFGCEGGGGMGMDGSFLLQPDLKLPFKPGGAMKRNHSRGFLPELSVRDCEVNAPLSEDFVPLAVDCVHLLDAEA